MSPVKVQQIKNGKTIYDYDKSIKSKKTKCDFINSALKESDLSFEWRNIKKQPYIGKVKLFGSDVDLNMYISSVTYLGNPHPTYKKRMQLSDSADRSYLKIDNSHESLTFMLGLYIFDEDNPIIVAWDSTANKNAGKSKSSHVYINDILLAMQNGVSQRKDIKKNNIYCFKPQYFKDFIKYNYQYLEHKTTFIEYINQFVESVDEFMFLRNIIGFLKEDLEERNSVWEGKDALIEMKNNEYRNWGQTEWQGFFLEYLIQQEFQFDEFDELKIENVLEMPGPRYGNTVFDGFYNIPWDFKVHVNKGNQVIANDMEAVENAIDEYGKIGFIIVSGNAEIENDREFSDWRNELKGGLSKNQIENIKKNKPHRKLKVSFNPKEVIVITLSKEDIPKHGILKGVRNPNGKIRRDKLVINLNNLTEEDIIIRELLSDKD
jgi:hypothetical protein